MTGFALALAFLATKTMVAGTAGTAGTAVIPAETPMPEATARPDATSKPDATPLRAPGLGASVLFRGECEYRGGCQVTAAGIVTDAGLQPIACDASNEAEVRSKIAARYFVPGTQLDLYARGASAGTFEITSVDATRNCIVRADGHKRNVPMTVKSFVALLPEDPVKLAALKFPGNQQGDAKAIVIVALKEAGVTATSVDLDVLRRFRDGATSILAIDAEAAGKHVLCVAEGKGLDAAAYKLTYSVVTPGNEAHYTLVDALDLGADGHAELLLERNKPDGGLEWILLRRTAGTWKP